MDTKNAAWLRTKLSRICTSTRFCGMCLEPSDNLCPLNMEFVISKQKSSKSFVDLLNYIFHENIENIVSSTGICESCTEHTLQAYIFIHNTRQLSHVINNCVGDIYSKTIDLSEQIDDTINRENVNIMIILESEPELLDIIDNLTNIEVMPTNSPKIVKNLDYTSVREKRVSSNEVTKLHHLATNTVNPNDFAINVVKPNDLAISAVNKNDLAENYLKRIPTNFPKIIKIRDYTRAKEKKTNAQEVTKSHDSATNAVNPKKLAINVVTPNDLAINAVNSNDLAISAVNSNDLTKKYEEKMPNNFPKIIKIRDFSRANEKKINSKEVTKSHDLATNVVNPNDSAMNAVNPNDLANHYLEINDDKEINIVANVPNTNTDVIEIMDVSKKNVQSDNKQAKINVKPEIYLKGGNIVINSMNTNNPPSTFLMNTYKCSQCVEIFTSYRTLKKHEKAKHKRVIYQCDFCNKIYNTLQYLKVHYKTHSKSICKICHMVLPKGELMQHLRTKHNTAIQIHPCKFCDLVYYSEEALETHFRAIHLKNCTETDENKDMCAMCLRNIPKSESKRHKCKYQCCECFMNPCIHYRYLTSYREQILNHSIEIKCVDCDYVTKRKEYLITHANREHLNHHPFVCNDCGTQFYTKMSLRMHIEQYHDTKNVCEYCEFYFKKSAGIKEHKEVCKKFIRPFPCNKCVARFDTQEELNNHDNLKHNNVGVACLMCNRRFLTKIELDSHVVAIHSEIQHKKRRKNIDCTLCNVKFKTIKELLEHENMHGPNAKYPCKVCFKAFYSLKKLYIHKQRHYERIQCSGCKKRVVTSFYPQHEVRCPYKRNMTFAHMCETCGKSYYLESHLRLHQKVHMERVPCPECGKMFKPFGLKKHLEKAHNADESSKNLYEHKGLLLVCNYCGHTVKRKGVLEAHINRYHLKIKPYVCNICNKSFCGSGRLKEHMTTHSDSNICYCSVCGKKFANRVCLKLHSRMHTGELPYSCDICGEKFRTSSIMKTHRVKKHLERTVPCPMCDGMFFMLRDMRQHFRKTHWKNKNKPFDVREILSEEYYHLFEDRRMAKIPDEEVENEIIVTEVVQSEVHTVEVKK